MLNLTKSNIKQNSSLSLSYYQNTAAQFLYSTVSRLVYPPLHPFSTSLPLSLLLQQHEQEGHVVAADAAGAGGVLGQAVVQHLLGDAGSVQAPIQPLTHEITLLTHTIIDI